MKGFKQEQEGVEDVSNGRYLSVYSTVDGPKLRDLRKRLNTSSFEALGILVFFWLWGQNNTNEAGEILNASEEDIARYLYGVGVGCSLEPNDVVTALIETGWIDKTEEKLVIHDWETWQSDWLSAQARREKDAKRKAAARRGAGSGDEPVPGESDGSIQYSKPFEEFWLAYPRKDEKGSAYKKYMARLKNGYSAEDLLMKKIVNPTMHEGYGAAPVRGFCRIEFEDGKLSICGVIGPTRNGNCNGSAGQCVDEIRKGKPAEGWTDEMIRKLCDIWDAWHLNDMRPYCEHQKKLGWDKLAGKQVNLYNYTLTRDAVIEKNAAEKCALDALKKGETFTPTPEQVKFASLPYSIQLHEEISGEVAVYYKPKKPIYNGDEGPVEVKTLGWLRPEEHPDGLLCRPCPVCGYKYGTSWKKEEVPQDVIDWLFNLPDTTVRPAWV